MKEKYICEFCNKEFFGRKSMGHHIQPKSKGKCRELYKSKYGEDLESLPWNKKVKCLKCDNLVSQQSKTKLCHKCASKGVSKNRERNAKLTNINKKFVSNGKVDWRCEFCNFSFLTKSELNNHAKNKKTKCSELYYKKYRIQALFPWNNYIGTDSCKSCNVIVPKGVTFCKKCSTKIISNRPEFKKISSESKKGDKHWLRKPGAVHPCKNRTYEEIHGYKKSLKLKEYLSKKQTEIMNNGFAAYMCSFVKNPSIEQVALFKKVKSLYPSAILQYPILSLNYCLDIAIPDLVVAIEHDMKDYHSLKEVKNNDIIRQNKLESEGWKFIRYIDIVPNIEQIKKDIDSLI